MEEVWKKTHIDAYSVSNLGRVRNDERGHLLKPSVRSKTSPYYHVVLVDKNKAKHHYAVHRLVATAFLGEPPPRYVVNHIDANTFNNRADNLEWVTQSDNLKHAFKLGRKHTDPSNVRKAIDATKRKVINVTLGKEYESIAEAGRAIGGRGSGISKVLSGERKHYMGMVFKYVNEL